MPENFSRLDDLLCRVAWRLDTSETSEIVAATRRTPLHAALFAVDHNDILEERFGAWRRFIELRERSREIPDFMRPFIVWSYPFAIAQLIRSLPGMIFGFAGPPGSGKTTLASIVVLCLRALDPTARVAEVSLDDFYLPKEERLKRGFRWRAQPGTHDIEAAVSLIGEVLTKRPSVAIPRFNPSADEPRPAERIAGPLSLLLIEGWFLGKRDEGYDRVGKLLDYLIYLDCPLPLARRRRFEREADLRTAGAGGGMSAEEMRQFWLQVLEPGIELWVKPVQQQADLVISFNMAGEIAAARRQIP